MMEKSKTSANWIFLWWKHKIKEKDEKLNTKKSRRDRSIKLAECILTISVNQVVNGERDKWVQENLKKILNT